MTLTSRRISVVPHVEGSFWMVSKLLFSRNTRTSALYVSKSNCSCPGANFATHSGRLQLMSRDFGKPRFIFGEILSWWNNRR